MKTGGFISAATLARGRLLFETRGSMTIPGLVFFTVLMAVGGFAIDIQRVYGVHGQMQAFVDDAALAAAAELDGQASAVTRAFNAACGINCTMSAAFGPLINGKLANSARFATTKTLDIERVTFLSSISADPGPFAPTPTQTDVVLCKFEAPNFATDCTGSLTPATASATAKFVEVVVAPRTISYIVLPIANAFGQVFGTGQLQASVKVRATAGFRRAICNNTPLMVCNPNEVINGSGADFTLADWLGRQILARVQGTGWSPPNFGLLDNFPGTGANAMEEAMAKVSPGTICTEDQVSIKPGQNTGPVQFGMNVRFDWYQGDMTQNSDDAQYRPAPNVVKGMKAGNGQNGACNPDTSGTSIPFPRDNCFMGSVPSGLQGTGCLAYGGENRFGDGNWARDAYWDANHPDIPVGSRPAGYQTWSRYQTYRYEITTPAPVNLANDEKGAPACYGGNVAPDLNPDRDRRLLYVAVVNCVQNAAVLGQGPVPVKAYAKVFMTEPVGNTDWSGKLRTITPASGTPYTITWGPVDNQDMTIEIVDVVKPNDESGHLHVYPVLYR